MATAITLYLFIGAWVSGAIAATAFTYPDRYRSIVRAAALAFLFWPVVVVGAGRSVLTEIRKSKGNTSHAYRNKGR